MSSEEEPGGALLAGRYEIGPAVGHGSTAAVHRAHDRFSGQDVAVKLFTGAPSPADDGRDQREIDILTGLRHPGLVAFRDAGHADGRLFVVMDLIEGPTLADAMREGPLPPDDVAALGADLATALAHVHRNGVVHRDVKPANILLDADRRPRLTDFGIAHLDGATRVTRTGLIVGTAAYMAPEQVRGATVGAPADVYALGLVLLEAVTGVREYPGAPVEAAVARLHRSPAVPRDLPPRLASAIRRMTATAPADRPTAPAVAELLRGTRTSPPAACRLVPLAALAGLVVAAFGGYAALQVGAGPAVAAAAAPQPVARSAAPPAVEPGPPIAPTTPADVPRAAAVVAVPVDRAAESRPERAAPPPAPVAQRAHEAPPSPPAVERPASRPVPEPARRGPAADEPVDRHDRSPGRDRDDDADADDDADDDAGDDAHDDGPRTGRSDAERGAQDDDSRDDRGAQRPRGGEDG